MVDVSWVCSTQMHVVVLLFHGGKVGLFSDWEKTWKKTLQFQKNQGCPSRNCTFFSLSRMSEAQKMFPKQIVNDWIFQA